VSALKIAAAQAKLPKFPVNFPAGREFGSGDGFDLDCVRHHFFLFPPIARRARDEHFVSVMLTTEQKDGLGRIADDCFYWFAGRHSDDSSRRRLVGKVCFDCVTPNDHRATIRPKRTATK
jgi:hypothetical protein